MKQTLTLLVAFLISISSFAQTGINYKAVIKDNLGNVVAGQPVTVQFIIYKGSALTNNVYQESHPTNTDANGIAIVNIGKGTTSDVFTDIDWGSDEHWLNVQVDIGSGLVDMGTTQFMAVPYALNVTGLEAIDEGNGIGWRIKGRNPLNYGNIGSNAIDLSYRVSPSFNDNGAIGSYSIAMGQNTKASGINSTAMGASTSALGEASTAIGENSTAIGITSIAMGRFAVASGNRSVAMGDYITAPSVSETAIGQFNTGYAMSGSGNLLWNDSDRLFTIGNGQLNANSDALVILKNGTIIAPSLDIGEITSNKTLITKEYLEANTSLPTGLEKITENANSGWRLIGQESVNYGNIGKNAIDLSFSDTNSSTRGATGESSTAIGYQSIASGDFSTSIGHATKATENYSTAMGSNTTASGIASTVMGVNTTASGEGSIAMGLYTNAQSYFETVIGAMNTNYTPSSTTSWNPADRLFTIGNGDIDTGNIVRSNAVTVLKNGKVGIGRDTPASLLEVAHGNTGPTNADRTDAFSIRNKSTNQSWQFHTSTYLNLYFNGTYRGSWNSTSGAYVQFSDRRLKKDITPLDNGTLNKVMQLNPVSYLMKEQTDTKRNLGLISQEVQEIFPSITRYVEESDLLTLSYTELIPILIKALQEQQAIIEAQNAKFTDQDKAITALLQRMDQLERTNNN
jgi:hypothetical protein